MCLCVCLLNIESVLSRSMYVCRLNSRGATVQLTVRFALVLVWSGMCYVYVLCLCVYVLCALSIKDFKRMHGSSTLILYVEPNMSARMLTKTAC